MQYAVFTGSCSRLKQATGHLHVSFWGFLTMIPWGCRRANLPADCLERKKTRDVPAGTKCAPRYRVIKVLLLVWIPQLPLFVCDGFIIYIYSILYSFCVTSLSGRHTKEIEALEQWKSNEGSETESHTVQTHPSIRQTIKTHVSVSSFEWNKLFD